ERTLGVLTKIDLMDKGTDAAEILEGKSYRLKFPWVGVVNRSQADINKNVDMIAARRREREYFSTTPEYKHLAPRMGSEHLAKMLSKPLISKTVAELEAELSRLGKPISADAGGKLYTIMEICRLFDGTYKEHLLGALALLNKVTMVIESSVITIRGPAEAAVDAVHAILKDLVHKSVNETPELKQYPALRVEVTHAASDSLERMREESKKATLKLVDMECSYLTVDFFRKLPQDVEKGGNPSHSIFDRYNDSYLRRIGITVLADVNMTKQLSSLLNEDPAIMERRSALTKRLELYRSAQAEIDSVAWAK
ncbi:Hypothetical predicted protein, partial [Prunus dulcis]